MPNTLLNQRYQLVRLLGRGTDSDVYLCLDAARGSVPRAIKSVRTIDPSTRSRLAGEFRRLTRLSQLNLVRVYELDVAERESFLPEGTVFFTADHVEGVSPLVAVSQARPEDRPGVLLAIARDVALALIHIHASGLIHHDIKPGNILVTPSGRSLVLDFGLSAVRAAAGRVRGSPAYMAPEAFAGASDPRIDLYSLGATLFEAACGEPPFLAESLSEQIARIIEAPVPSLRARASFVPEDFARVVTRLLAKDPWQRYPSASSLLEALVAMGATATDEDSETQQLHQQLHQPVHQPVHQSDRSALASLLPPPLVGRDDSLASLEQAIAALASEHARPRVLRFLGAPGTGKTRLVVEAIRRHQLRVAAGHARRILVLGDCWQRLLEASQAGPGRFAGLSPPDRAEVDRQGREAGRGREQEDETGQQPELPRDLASVEWDHARQVEQVARFLQQSAGRAPVLVHLADADSDGRSRSLVNLAAAGGIVGSSWLVVSEHRTGAGNEQKFDGGELAITIPLAPLSFAEVQTVVKEMLGRAPSAEWSKDLAIASAGIPRLVVEAVRSAVARAGVRLADNVPVAEFFGDGLASLITVELAAVTGSARAFLEAVAAWGEPVAIEDIAAVLSIMVDHAHELAGELAASGLVVIEKGSVRLPSPVHSAAVSAETSASTRRALAKKTLEQLDRKPGNGSRDEERNDSSDEDRDERRAGTGTEAEAETRIGTWAATANRDGGLSSRIRARQLLALGHPGTLEWSLRAVLQCHTEGDQAGALDWLGKAVAGASQSVAAAIHLRRAQLATALARYSEAIAAADAAKSVAETIDFDSWRSERDSCDARVVGLIDVPEHPRIVVREAGIWAARALKRSGNLEAAAIRLQELLGTPCEGGECSQPPLEDVLGELAMIKIAKGEYEDALRLAGRPEDEPEDQIAAPDLRQSGRAVRLEAVGLASLYVGDLDRAQQAFGRLLQAAEVVGDRALWGRAEALLGMLAQRQGDLAKAAALYTSAHDRAHEVGDIHASAVYALNEGSVLIERGELERALEATAKANVEFRRIGRVAEGVGAVYNHGVALLALGDQEAACRAADRALVEARQHGLPLLEIHALLLLSEAARYAGATERALAFGQDASVLAERIGAMRTEVAANEASLQARLGARAAAHAALERAQRSANGEGDQDRVAMAVARVHVVLDEKGHDDNGNGNGSNLRPILEMLVSVLVRLEASGKKDQSWRAATVAGCLELEMGNLGGASSLAVSARTCWEELTATVSEGHIRGMLADPDRRLLERLEHDLAAAWASESVESAAVQKPSACDLSTSYYGMRTDGHSLRRLLVLAKKLNSELRLEPLLDEVVDAMIELACAERGFILLSGESGTLKPAVARNFDQRSLGSEEQELSLSIAQRTARTGEPVVAVDASSDERFSGAASISALGLRSVLAVPLRVRGETTGTVYLDHRFRRGAFDSDTVERVLELADLAAVALHNARLTVENNRRQKEIAELNVRLKAELERQTMELDGARAALQAATKLRHSYPDIVGRSPRMLEALKLVDRAAETSLPVIIQGESGTGKELVAQALHRNGPRRDRPFVPINCAAVPDTLLESELFGHLRGAFTGADRERRGLLEVADGGTVFLDEIGETTGAMQAKLLRFLQGGEIRRLGGERTKIVNVRVIAATNRDLRSLVDDGRFREDLFYRLNVIRIDLPPLREHPEDIPVLVEHFLARVASSGKKERSRRIEPAAMAKLIAFSWPGNARQLENEILRSASLGGDVIGVADLSPQVVTATGGSAGMPATGLELRPRVEHLEASLIKEALGRTGGNYSASAKLLGLSRFGLQKKLKRYQLEGKKTGHR
ncbi:MAG: sigma 54-interacting transcriptional regulator [Pseudomonadota bacterium]